MLAGIVATTWVIGLLPALARVGVTVATGFAVVPWMTRLPLVSTELANPLVVSAVATAERFCAGVLTTVSILIWICGATAVAGTPALASLSRNVTAGPTVGVTT